MKTSEKRFLVVFAVCFVALVFMKPADAAKREFLEKDYQFVHCPIKTEREYRLPNKMRVDCLNKTHAVEYDWAKKYREAFTQALEYSMHTGKKAGIVLILEKPTDIKYLKRLQAVIKFTGVQIDVWTVGPAINTKKTLVSQ